MNSNITLMKWMIANGYQDARTLKRRIKAMEDWIANGTLLSGRRRRRIRRRDRDRPGRRQEPIVACPNDPDDVKLLSKSPATRSTKSSSARA